MSEYSMFKTSYSEIKDPELKSLVDHVAGLLKVSIQQTVHNRAQNTKMDFTPLKVGGKKVVQYASVAEVVDTWLGTQKPEEVQRFTRNVNARVATSRSLFMDSTLRSLNFKSKKDILAEIDYKRSFNYVNEKLIVDRIGGLFGLGDLKNPPTGPTAPVPNLSLKINLKRVKCLDETNGEIGKDEIAIGGVTVDDKGVEAQLREFDVSSFHTGDTKNFNPVKILKSFALDNVHPSTFLAFIALAEKDSGGFAQFLDDLYDAIKANVTLILAAVGAAAGAAIGTAIGGSIGTAVGGPIGAIIGIVAGLILGALIGWLVGAFRDEIFEPQMTGITLNSSAPFTGPIQRFAYRDFGGVYTVDTFWSAS